MQSTSDVNRFPVFSQLHGTQPASGSSETRLVRPVVSFPQSVPAREAITQIELTLLLSLRGRLKQLQDELAAEESALKTRLEAGAIVEPGDHSAKLKENFRRNVAWKAVVIRLARRLRMDGAAYCARVLASTKATRTLSLEID